MPEKQRVVLDTNVLLSGILFGGTFGEIIELWRRNAFVLIISPETLAELIGKLRYKFSLPSKIVSEWQELISERSVHVAPDYVTKVCPDAEDNKFIDVALTGRAEYLVTGGKNLLSLNSYRQFKILKPKEFLLLMKAK